MTNGTVHNFVISEAGHTAANSVPAVALFALVLLGVGTTLLGSSSLSEVLGVMATRPPPASLSDGSGSLRF